MRVLVTGAAGFIGYHTCEALLARGDEVHGVDDLNDYYDVRLKEARLQRLRAHESFSFSRCDIAEATFAEKVATFRPDGLINLAAQAGVRYSLEHPQAYVQSNLVGFGNVLEACRHQGVKHLVYASSSSVYGGNTKQPFAVADPVDSPISLYAATKKANELMAHSYSHLFGVATTGLRFFTVYGPWGRPDMALFLFTRAILNGEPINVFNHGDMMRDFTYIDDIVEGVLRVLDRPPSAEANASLTRAPYRVFNIGSARPTALGRMIEILEAKLGKRAERNLLPMQPGDVKATSADVAALVETVDYRPDTSLEVGIGRFVEWYREYHGV
ncbi:MAG: NAD-dependent epimerase [Myxococcota bacterium]